jgi:hypothetical protein
MKMVKTYVTCCSRLCPIRKIMTLVKSQQNLIFESHESLFLTLKMLCIVHLEYTYFLWLSQHLTTGLNSGYRLCVWGKTWSYILYMLYELNKLYNSCIGFLLSSARVVTHGSVIVYRILVGLLNQKGFALLRRIYKACPSESGTDKLMQRFI